MSRAFPVWLLASALCAFVGCGGGDATDTSAVAENSGAAAPAGGSGAAMPSGGSGMAPESSGMGSASANAMMGAAGGPGASPDPAMYGSGGAMNPAAMSGTGTAAGTDAAAMAAGYPGTGTEGAPGTGTGLSPEMAAGYPGTTAGGATLGGNYPGGANPGGAAYPGGANPGGAAYPGGAYPGAANPEDAANPASGEVAYPGGAYPGSGGPGTGGAVEEKVPDTFDGKAQLAFRRGKEHDALQYLYAHALTTDAGAESILPTIRWVGGEMKQPKLAVRWGAGFIVTAPRNFNGDPKPVGSQQTIPTRDGNRKGGGGNEGYVGGGGGAEYGGGESGGGSGSLLSKGAGELGDKLAAAYTERLMRGDFGEVLKQAMESKSGGNQGNAGGDGAAGYGAEGGAGFGANRMAAGAGGLGGAGGGSGLGGAGGGGGAADAKAVTQLLPGLSMLGVGNQKELIERAREDGIDAVVIIDMKLRVSPSSNLVTNDSTLALFDVKSQKKLHTTKTFNNIKIQTDRAADKEDGVDPELEKLFAAIDANFIMTDLPDALTAEIVAKRIASLIAEKRDNPLPVLAEARMYYAKGLLEESELFAAYEQILGVDSGRLLATGSEEEKKKALDRWLPAT